VSLEPFTGTITLPPEFVAALKDFGLKTIEGGGGVSAYFDEADDTVEAFFPVGPVALPPDDTLTFDVDADVEPPRFRPQDAGVHTLLVDGFGIGVDTGKEQEEEEGPGAFISCVPLDDEDLVVDALEVTAKPTPTTTVTATATATPVRPVVVQTDAVKEEGLATAPLLAAGTLAALVAGGLALPRRAPRASRRH
jgi:hypothetical protein